MQHQTQTTQNRRESAKKLGQAAIDWYQNQGIALASDGALPASTVTCFDPSTGHALWDIPEYSAAQIDACVGQARAAQPAWEALQPADRARALLRCADALEAHKDALADVLALETGKSLTQECLGEVGLPVAIFRYFAGVVHEIKGRSIQAGPSLMGFTTYHPWGVVAGIVPWNVPLMFMAYKVAAPLAAGNTVVIKMPEQATATLAMALRLILPCLPEGTVHFVSGSGDGTGNTLVTHPDVDKISFTGSVATGSKIYQQAAKDMRAVTLELGGKSPMIILDDCDLDKAVTGIIGSMRFTRAGQSCTAASRIYVPKSRLTEYKDALAKALNALTIGDALDVGTDSGPVVTLAQKQRIDAFIDQAKADGLEVEKYGTISSSCDLDAGFFVQPHLIFDPDHNHPVSQEEIFGPVATVTAYEDLETAMHLANGTAFGLSASVWGRDITKCMTCAAQFRAGIVQINQNAIMLPGFSYGGVGLSGVGKESSLEAMLETYMYEKTNIVNYSE